MKKSKPEMPTKSESVVYERIVCPQCEGKGKEIIKEQNQTKVCGTCAGSGRTIKKRSLLTDQDQVLDHPKAKA